MKLFLTICGKSIKRHPDWYNLLFSIAKYYFHIMDSYLQLLKEFIRKFLPGCAHWFDSLAKSLSVFLLNCRKKRKKH